MSLVQEKTKRFLSFKRKRTSLSSLYEKASNEIISENISLFMDESLIKVQENELILLHSFIDLYLKRAEQNKANTYFVNLNLNDSLIFVDKFIKKYSS